jgi:hypothetical protein
MALATLACGIVIEDAGAREALAGGREAAVAREAAMAREAAGGEAAKNAGKADIAEDAEVPEVVLLLTALDCAFFGPGTAIPWRWPGESRNKGGAPRRISAGAVAGNGVPPLVIRSS